MQAQDFIKDFKGKGVILTKEGYKKAKIAIASNGGVRPTADKIGMYFETVSKLNNEQVVAFDSWKRLFDALIEEASKSAA